MRGKACRADSPSNTKYKGRNMAISESMPECLALQQKYASLFHIKKCSTQYVAHFIWVTEFLKIGEYVTICSTQYILPAVVHIVCYIL